MSILFSHKIPAPVNFLFPVFDESHLDDGEGVLSSDHGEVRFSIIRPGTVRIRARLGRGGRVNHSRVRLNLKEEGTTRATESRRTLKLKRGATEVTIDRATGTFTIRHDKRVVVRSLRAPFGVSDTRQMVLLQKQKDSPVYGLGEKTGGLNKAGKPFVFWNVDVLADHPHSFADHDYEPGYASVPVAHVAGADGFACLYNNNMGLTWMHTGMHATEKMIFEEQLAVRSMEEDTFMIATQEGELDLFVLAGPSLFEAVCRYGRLTGTAAVPPSWALGYHQCRWSYDSANELLEVADKLAEARIPVSAMWMDIDYMEGFRVFTWNRKNFSTKDRKRVFDELHRRGIKLVTIVDPGVKVDEGYDVYTEGMQRDIFCRSAEGVPFIGLVWPGRTVFPDFSLRAAREFWAEKIADLVRQGIDGIWIDMNDPSTGRIDFEEMRFDGGKQPHATLHNQYADLMARATQDGIRRAKPEETPFVLTRSACAGSQNYTSIWTGDNVSNEKHLRMSIPMSLNLSLSGFAMVGPDVGGFVGDCSEELMVTWMLAGTLFPFLRNHSCIGTARQEPYVFSKTAQAVIRKCINTRLKLLPYIHLQFMMHEFSGEPVMRPMAMQFPEKRFESVDDQYMLGPMVMVAPFVDLESRTRTVELPRGWWFDMARNAWVQGGGTITVRRTNKLQMYVWEGAILPTLQGHDFFPQPDMQKVEWTLFLRTPPPAKLLKCISFPEKNRDFGFPGDTPVRVIGDGSEKVRWPFGLMG